MLRGIGCSPVDGCRARAAAKPGRPCHCAPAAFWCIVCAGARRQARFRLVGGQSIIERVGNGGLVETFERIAAELGQDAALHGIEVVKTSAHRRHGETELRLVIDKPGGVDVATCERISHKVNAALDGFADPYTLSVESVGALHRFEREAQNRYHDSRSQDPSRPAPRLARHECGAGADGGRASGTARAHQTREPRIRRACRPEKRKTRKTA